LHLYSAFIKIALQLPHIHPFIHRRRCQPCKVTTNTSGVVKCLAQGNLKPATFLLPDTLLHPELFIDVRNNKVLSNCYLKKYDLLQIILNSLGGMGPGSDVQRPAERLAMRQPTYRGHPWARWPNPYLPASFESWHAPEFSASWKCLLNGPQSTWRMSPFISRVINVMNHDVSLSLFLMGWDLWNTVPFSDAMLEVWHCLSHPHI